jgi:hypothetical protein
LGGLAAAYLLAGMRGILMTPQELEEAFGLPVVGTLSWEEAWHTKKRKRPARGSIAVAGVGILMLTSFVGWIVMGPRSFEVRSSIQNMVAPLLDKMADKR